VRALVRVLPVRTVYAFDTKEGAALVLASNLRAELGIEVEPVSDLGRAVEKSGVCVTCTPSREPFLMRSQVRPGTFVAGIGADNPQKSELEPALLAAATVVADLLDQCAVMGDLHHALEAGVVKREDVHAELADLVSGRKPGRRSPAEITVFDSTGTAIQDVAVAAHVYEKAVASGRGLRIALGG
jgi:ornithine cyclodeaminase/alanine dehydrogenase-like protein (mu-crystallin family)